MRFGSIKKFSRNMLEEKEEEENKRDGWRLNVGGIPREELVKMN